MRKGLDNSKRSGSVFPGRKILGTAGRTDEEERKLADFIKEYPQLYDKKLNCRLGYEFPVARKRRVTACLSPTSSGSLMKVDCFRR